MSREFIEASYHWWDKLNYIPYFELILQPPSPDVCLPPLSLKYQPFIYMVSLEQAISIFSHLISTNYQVWSMGSTKNNKSFLSLAKFQGLKGYLPGPGTKVISLCQWGQIHSHTSNLSQVLISGALPDNHPACSSLSLSPFARKPTWDISLLIKLFWAFSKDNSKVVVWIVSHALKL